MNEREFAKLLVDKLASSVTRSVNQKYETAEKFFTIAEKLATLTPGCRVYVDGKKPAVFLCCHEGRAKVLGYDDDKEIVCMDVPYACLTFEPVETATTDDPS